MQSSGSPVKFFLSPETVVKINTHFLFFDAERTKIPNFRQTKIFGSGKIPELFSPLHCLARKYFWKTENLL